MKNMAGLRADGFPDDFLWGCSTASYQIEGAAKADGRGLSIWDEMSHRQGCIVDGGNGDDACDSYHLYGKDIALLKELNVGAYRFSISWPRIQPDGKGAPNEKGLDYYSRLVDALLEAGIEPWITLYHWDLPLALQEEGGWPLRDTAFRFADYAQIMFRNLGTRVRHWTSLNEPWCSAFLGYRDGEHAPGIRDFSSAIRSVHHLLLAHGLSTKVFRQSGLSGEYGIVINPSAPRPATLEEKDAQAAQKASIERTSLWLDPLFGRGYPREYVEAMSANFPVAEGDMDLISQPLDFIGVNYYTEDAVCAVQACPENPLGFLAVPSWQQKTEMGWDIVPQGLRRVLGFIAGRWSPKALYVTENGAAFIDMPDSSGKVHDRERIAYLHGHIGACRDAVDDGIPLKGYFVWTLMDNFEWAFGYSLKFGLTSVDPSTHERRPKDSFYYYRDTVCGFGF